MATKILSTMEAFLYSPYPGDLSLKIRTSTKDIFLFGDANTSWSQK